MLFDAPFLYTVGKTNRERVFSMYEGKYVACKLRRRPAKWMSVSLYALNLVLLVFAAVRVFSCGSAAATENKVLARQDAAPGIVLTEPAQNSGGDREAPVIEGVKDIIVYAGDTVSYRSGISVTDDTDRGPNLDIDSSKVDLSTPGTYQVVYTSSDESGNRAVETATVTVLPKEDNYVDLETIYTAADKVLKELFWDGITPREQVGVIYTWARENLSYGGHSDRTDWRQTAYTMLTQRKGDCYGYFAVTKLFFERLGIPNIDVEKVKNSEKDSNHFWSLVSVDGGTSYYHFDATPRVGQTIDFCLITDELLDEYSNANNGSHNRDKSLYPATPEERP